MLCRRAQKSRMTFSKSISFIDIKFWDLDETELFWILTRHQTYGNELWRRCVVPLANNTAYSEQLQIFEYQLGLLLCCLKSLQGTVPRLSPRGRLVCCEATLTEWGVNDHDLHKGDEVRLKKERKREKNVKYWNRKRKRAFGRYSKYCTQ